MCSLSLTLSLSRSVLDFSYARRSSVYSIEAVASLSILAKSSLRCFIIVKISSLDGSQPRLPAPPAVAVAEHCSRMAMGYGLASLRRLVWWTGHMDARFSFFYSHFFSFLTRTITLTVSQIFRWDFREIGSSDGEDHCHRCHELC
jgi:hypothetical protein